MQFIVLKFELMRMRYCERLYPVEKWLRYEPTIRTLVPIAAMYRFYRLILIYELYLIYAFMKSQLIFCYYKNLLFTIPIDTIRQFFK